MGWNMSFSVCIRHTPIVRSVYFVATREAAEELILYYTTPSKRYYKPEDFLVHEVDTPVNAFMIDGKPVAI
jgi:hypothetical protein